MIRLVIGACLLSALGLSSVATAEPKDYVARMNENGLYCARVDVQGINGLTQRKTRCRSLEQWAAKGYIVDVTRDPSEVQ
jgi:hypothetical protein